MHFVPWNREGAIRWRSRFIDRLLVQLGYCGFCSIEVMANRPALLAAVLAALVMVRAPEARSEIGPVVPCGAAAEAAYPDFADPPNARNWHARDLAGAWTPPDCVGWGDPRFTLLTALAGRFHFDGTVEELLAKFGAQSAWRGIRYWSTTDRRWEVLIEDAAALEAADPERRRPDFALPELESGKELLFLQADNRSSGPVVYRMRILDIEPDHLVVAIENVSTVWLFIFPIYNPGDLQSTYIIRNIASGIWGYYSLTGARERSVLTRGNDASYLNRAAAIYRHLIGVPGDRDPPIAP